MSESAFEERRADSLEGAWTVKFRDGSIRKRMKTCLFGDVDKSDNNVDFKK